MAEYKLPFTGQEIENKLKNIPTKTSDLTNDSGFITGYTETDPTVPAWAKASSKPSYTKSEVGLGNVDDVKQYSASNPPPYPVTSVNDKTGAVTLSASDVGADASGTASSAVSVHNTNTSAHTDIRTQINQLSSEIEELKSTAGYTNSLLTAKDVTNISKILTGTDGSVGYLNNHHVTSGQYISENGVDVTGLIPAHMGDIIRLKNVVMKPTVGGLHVVFHSVMQMAHI